MLIPLAAKLAICLLNTDGADYRAILEGLACTLKEGKERIEHWCHTPPGCVFSTPVDERVNDKA